MNSYVWLMNILLSPKLKSYFVSYLYRTGNLDRKQTLLRLCWIIWYLTCHLYKNPTFFFFKNYHKESYISIDEVRGWVRERNKMKDVWHLSDGVYASILFSDMGKFVSCLLRSETLYPVKLQSLGIPEISAHSSERIILRHYPCLSCVS